MASDIVEVSAENLAAGTYRITTRSGSVYLLDRRTMVREPDATGAVLRADAAPVPMLAAGGCHLGAPLVLFLDIVGDGETVTRRITTEVTRIEVVNSTAI